MSSVSTAPFLSLDDGGRAERLRQALDRAGYHEQRLLKLLGLTRWPITRQRLRARSLYLRRTCGGSPLETLARLFLLQEPAGREMAGRALEPLTVEEGVEAGLLRLQGDEVTAAVQLGAQGNLLAAADWPAEAGADRLEVMEIGATSRLLAQVTIRRSVGRTLDLGTGCGVQAFLAAAHSGEVVGVDANPRAVRYAAANARLNGIANVVFREGNLFDPVRGESFDLIVCNPPFVIGPRSDFLHSDGGMPGDELCQAIVRATPAYLREGGVCQLLCNWAQQRGEDWRQRLEGWFAGSGCDVWVLHAQTLDAAEYASDRVAERAEGPEEAARRFDDWMAYFDRAGIEAVGYGILTLRRSGREATWTRIDSLPELVGACGEAIARRFERRDFLEAHADDRKLLRARLRVAPELRWELLQAPSREGWSLVQSRLRLAEGLAVAGDAEVSLADFLGRCDGKRPLDELLGKPAGAQLAARLQVVRQLIQAGYLTPAREE